ncbi:hypothetical protein BJ170DRAFT_688417 [Xylariales sp. AK1849]|nr:hypothetical protein BJ170DRAFT_688417 [Xylariales sp. AK1849]
MATRLEHIARQTSPVERYGQAMAPRTPEATAAPFHPRWAAMGMNELFDRATTGLDTCGYISASDSYYPLTCGTSYTCTNSGDYRGCCQSSLCSASTNFFTRCYDSTASACSGTNVGPNTLCCTYSAAYPYCITYLWSTTASPGAVFTEFNCDASRFSGQYFLAASTPSTTSSSSSTSTTRTTSATTTSSLATASSSPAAVPIPSESSSSSSGGGSSTNIGAIVGGVVGGVAVLALIGLGIWFFLRKKKQNNTHVAAQEQPQMAQSTGYPSPPPPGAQGSNYDSRYSYAAPGSQFSPTTQGYPSPAVSPAPYYNPQHGGQEAWGQPQGGYMHPQSTGETGVPKDAGQPGYFEASKDVAEAPAVNPVGTGGHRAELA